mgnify:CR=1 FL=1
MNYNIITYFTDGTSVVLPVSYEKEYELRRDVTNIGVNGLLQKKDTMFEYFPPHKIDKIEVIETKP